MNSLKPSLTTQEHQAISEQFVEPVRHDVCVLCDRLISSPRQCEDNQVETCGECE